MEITGSLEELHIMENKVTWHHHHDYRNQGSIIYVFLSRIELVLMREEENLQERTSYVTAMLLL